MKNLDMHKSLPDAEKRERIATCMYPYVLSSASIEKQIAELQKQLATAKIREAAEDAARAEGWKTYDVSDYLEDQYQDFCLPFVGTEQELESVFGIKEAPYA